VSASGKQLAFAAIAGAALVGIGIWIGRSSATLPPQSQQPPAETEPAPATNSSTSIRRSPSSIPQRPALARPAAADPSLEQDLVASDPKIRRAAVHELVRGSDPDPAMLVAASKDADLEVAVVATRALGKLYAQGQVPLTELVARARDRGASERVRQTALNAFGQVASEDAAKILVDLLARGDVGERRTAAVLLQNQDMAIAVPALIGALGDTDEVVRSNALEALKARSRGRDFGTDASAWQSWWQSRSK
jgi:hypothetical protein